MLSDSLSDEAEAAMSFDSCVSGLKRCHSHVSCNHVSVERFKALPGQLLIDQLGVLATTASSRVFDEMYSRLLSAGLPAEVLGSSFGLYTYRHKMSHRWEGNYRMKESSPVAC